MSNARKALENYARALESPQQRLLRLQVYKAKQRRYTNFLLSIITVVVVWKLSK